jgi:uncharacterized protein
MRRALALLAFAILWLCAAPAFAFVVPELTGRVVDQAGKLSSDEKQALEDKLTAFDRDTTNEIVVFVVASLGGERIEDVSYQAAKTWRIGKAGKDNGVLLTIAPAERKIRIETGKGVGDRLPDLRCNDIIRNRIAPELKRERFYAGIDRGVDDIIGALQPGWTYGGRTYEAPPQPSRIAEGERVLLFAMVAVFLTMLVVSWARHLRGGGASEAGWTVGSSSWSSSSDSGWSSGGDSWGSSFSGGGGDFGGGGSSDSY